MNTRELILHIGTEKTGTTSIQEFLAGNRDALLRKGIFVPRSLGEPAQRRLAVIANDDDFVDGFILREGLAERAVRVRTREKWRRKFVAEVERSAASRWIISSEHLSSRLFRPTEMQRLHDLLTPLFSRITVLVYLRDPLDAAVSLLSTKIKCGATTPRLPAPPTDSAACDDRSWPSVCHHRETLERWSAAFGECLSVRLFAPDTLEGGNILRDFRHAAQIPDDPEYALPPRHNESLSRAGIELLARVNRRVPVFVDDAVHGPRGDLVAWFERHLSQQVRYTPSAREVADYDAAFRDSNEWVRQKYFPERTRLFAPRRESLAPETTFDAAAVDALAEMVSALWLERSAYQAQARRAVRLDTALRALRGGRGKRILQALTGPFRRGDMLL